MLCFRANEKYVVIYTANIATNAYEFCQLNHNNLLKAWVISLQVISSLLSAWKMCESKSIQSVTSSVRFCCIACHTFLQINVYPITLTETMKPTHIWFDQSTQQCTAVSYPSHTTLLHPRVIPTTVVIFTGSPLPEGICNLWCVPCHIDNWFWIAIEAW